MTTAISVHGPEQVLAVLPYQLGFRPQDSLVAVALRDGQIEVVARIDLPPPDLIAEAVGAVLDPLLERAPSALILVGYETVVAASALVIDAASRRCHRLCVRVLARLVVRDGRWFDIDCTDAGCCPIEGRPMAREEQVPAVTELMLAGRRPLGSRNELAATVAHAAGDRAREVAQACRRLAACHGGRNSGAREQAQAARAWGEVLRSSLDRADLDLVSADHLARAALSLRDLTLRDELIGWLTPGALGDTDRRSALCRALRPSPATTLSIDGTHPAGRIGRASGAGSVDLVQQRLTALARLVPVDLAPPVLTVLACLVWWRGDGALAQVALDRALTLQPSYRLAVLLERLVRLGIRLRDDPADGPAQYPADDPADDPAGEAADDPADGPGIHEPDGAG